MKNWKSTNIQLDYFIERKGVPVDDYAKDGGPRAFLHLSSFYHDALRA